jgi:hypothetical protein
MQKKKSSAGRPPKNLTRKLENRRGIAAEPMEPRNFFELQHDNIDIFKFLFESCKRFKDTVEFTISAAGVKFYFNANRNIGIADLLGSRIVRFFCNIERTYKCRVEDLIKILKLKKNSEDIIFSISNDNPYKLNITFHFTETRYEIWSIDLDPLEPEDFSRYENLYANIENYPLSFTTLWSEFKDSVNGWKQFTSDGNVIFEKDIEGDLKMHFNEGTVGCVRYDNSNKVNYTGKDLFAVSIPIISLISVSASSVLAENITIYLKEESDAIMVAKLDESFKTKKEAIPDTETILIKFFISICD